MKYIYFFSFILIISFSGCDFLKKLTGSGKTADAPNTNAQEEIAYDANKDMSVQEYTLNERKKRALSRFPGDTLELMEFVLHNSAKGTYLIDMDKTSLYSSSKSAVVYTKEGNTQYIFGLIAKSGDQQNRVIEQKNIIGFESSFIDFDSTELGIAFFYLTLFRYDGGSFTKLWEAPVPSHGGFNSMTLENWQAQKERYIRINFHYAQGSGHIDYNYFLVDGIEKEPHLLMTYEGINTKRTMADVNHDKYADYREYKYVDTGENVYVVDSVDFIWQDTAYFNTRNKKQFRKY